MVAGCREKGKQGKMRGGLKKILPRTLFGRSLLILILPILLLQILSTFIFFDRHWTKMTSRLAFGVAGEIALAGEMIEADPSPAAVAQVCRRTFQALDVSLTYTPGEAGWPGIQRPRTDQDDPFIAGILRMFLEERVGHPFVIETDWPDHSVRVRVRLSGGVLEATIPQRRLFSSTGYIYLMWSAGLSLILLAIAIAFMRNQIRPIRKLAVAAERFGKGRDVPNFKPEGAIEVRQAARAFLEMRERIKRQIDQRTGMLAGISHDLRTPLTRMRLQLAMMPETSDTAAMAEDVAAMERMIAGYLDFVRGEGDEAPQRVDLFALAEKVVQAAVRDGGAQIVLEGQGPLFVSLRPMAFERALANLVGNARKYARHVRVSLRAMPEGFDILVDDDGPGIPQDLHEEVFRPFYRVDESRNAESGGVGLGLPIARDIVHAHGGRIWLDQSPAGGLRVGVFLPV